MSLYCDYYVKCGADYLGISDTGVLLWVFHRSEAHAFFHKKEAQLVKSLLKCKARVVRIGKGDNHGF